MKIQSSDTSGARCGKKSPGCVYYRMTSKQRFLAALQRKPTIDSRYDPPCNDVFLEKHLGGIGNDEFFSMFGLDPIRWIVAFAPDAECGQYYDPSHTPGYLEARRIVTDSWRITTEEVPDPSTVRSAIPSQPPQSLTTVLQSNEHTTWVAERLVKEKSDIDLIAEYGVAPICDRERINREAEAYGETGLLRGHIAHSKSTVSRVLAGRFLSLRN